MGILEIPLAIFLLLLLVGTPAAAVAALLWARRLDKRLIALEQGRHQGVAGPGPRPVPGPSPEPPPPPPPPAAPERPAAPPPAPRQHGLELTIGTRWLNVAGIVTLLFAAAFFLKYAYENAWIGPRGRVAIGIASGVAAILIGERTRRRGHVTFAQGLAAGGIACLYLSFFFSFRLYALIEIAPAFALMALVIAGGVALAILQDSLAVALLSFVGAYLTPFLLSTGRDSAGFLFAYLTLLALGALAVTRFRKWRALELLSFAGTFVTYAAWHAAHYRTERIGAAIAGLALFFVIFMLIPYGQALARARTTGSADHVMALTNAAVTFGYLYRMLHPLSPRALGFVALGLAAAFLGLGSIARGRSPGDRGLAVSLLGMSIAFLTLAVPLQLGLHGITLTWALQGGAIVWLGFMYGAPLTRIAGLGVLALAVVRLLETHSPLHARPFTFVLNASFGTWAGVVLAILVAAGMYRRRRPALAQAEVMLPSALAIVGAVLLLNGLQSETALWFSLHDLPADHRAAALMVVWAILPIAMLGVGSRLRDRPISLAALLLTGLSVAPFAVLVVQVAARGETLLANRAFLGGLAGAAAFLAAGSWAGRRGGPEPRARRPFIGAGTFLLLVLLTAEVGSHFALREGSAEETADNRFMASMAVSVLWALFASALMIIGFRSRARAARLAATALFGLTLSKAFVYDVWGLRAVYRIVSFLVLGLLLVAASFLYSRFRGRIAAALVCLAAAAGAADPARADHDPESWRFVAEVETAGLTGEHAWFALARDVLQASREDLADLRIVGRDGREVPFVVRADPSGVVDEPLDAVRLNQTRGEDGSLMVDLDFGTAEVKNVIEITTSGAEYRRRVEIRAREDDGPWRLVGDDYWIHRLRGADGEGPVVRAAIDIPDNDARWLRVTVHPMPDERETLAILDVGARRRVDREAETEPIASVGWTVTRDPDSRTTTIEIDLGYRNALPFLIDLEIEDEAFRRICRVLGRNAITAVRRRGLTETGDPIEEAVEAPWIALGADALVRVPAGRRGEAAVDRARLALRGDVRARYLRIVIDDHDNPPLRIRSVAVRALTTRLIFPIAAGVAYRLFTGNPDARAPVYDLASILPDPREHTPAAATLASLRENPAFGRVPGPPFTERHPWLLWIAMLAALGVLAILLRGAFRSLAGPSR